MARTQKRNKAKVIAALSEMPIIEAACKKADVSRATFYRWRKDDPEFEQNVDKAIQEGDDHVNGLAESMLINRIKEGHMPALRYWLNNRSDRFNYPKIQYKEQPMRTRPVSIFNMRTGKKLKMVEDTDDDTKT
jgi:hypothetical protein